MTHPIPGPWQVNRFHDVTGYPAFRICGLSGEQKRDDSRLETIERMIEAAPLLLAALELLQEEADDPCRGPFAQSHPCRIAVQEAIAAARGGR